MKYFVAIGLLNAFCIILSNSVANSCDATLNFVERNAYNSMPATSSPLDHCNRVSSTDSQTTLQFSSNAFNNGCSYIVHQFSDLTCDDEEKLVKSTILDASNRNVKINVRKPICSFRLNLSSTLVSGSVMVSFENSNGLDSHILQDTECQNLCQNSSHEYHPISISTYDNAASNTTEEIGNNILLYSKMNCKNSSLMGRIHTVRAVTLKQDLSVLTRVDPNVFAFMIVDS